jgi:hypothetical protein
MRAYSCLTKNGDWVELPRHKIVRRSQPSATPVPSNKRKSPAGALANRYTAIKKSAKSMKTNA